MYFYIYITLIYFLSTSHCLPKEGWNYVNLHCRDNFNHPADWWYIYKPGGEVAPHGESGRNFSYIMADTPGRWQQSERLITSNNMLFNTIAPMYRNTYVDYVAYIVFETRVQSQSEKRPASSTQAVLMADELGGYFLGHTVPGLIDINSDRPSFPESEIGNGHTLGCISLSLTTLNEIAIALRISGPRIVAMQIPKSMITALSSWVALYKNSVETSWPGPAKTSLTFHSDENTVWGQLLVRRPGVKECLYKKFAKMHSIVLDVYAPGRTIKKSSCTSGYGVRVIDSISVTIRDLLVQYINKNKDKSRFAVSTAAHWQKLGSNQDKQRYWACIGSLEIDDTSDGGGILLCIENYQIWASFDNLKIKEPECN